MTTSIGPRGHLEVGSREWAERTIEYAKHLWESRELTEERWIKVVDELKTGKAWKIYGKTSLDELLESEIGLGEAQSHVYVQRHAANPKELRNKNGGQWSKKDKPLHVTIDQKEHGNSAAYLTARIKKANRIDILERMKAGEFKSVKAAAIEAGVIKIPTVLQQLIKLWKKATPAEQQAFKDLL